MKYQICIDLTADVNDKPLEENIPLMCSPLFNTEQEADTWYSSCSFEYNNLDIIMVVYDESGNMSDTYIY